MRRHRPPKYRRITPATCRYCRGTFFYKTGGRPREFCDHICQQRDFRRSRRVGSGCDESRSKTQVTSTTSRSVFGDRPPVEILGHGHRWNGQPTIDREILKAIIEIEIDRVEIGEADMPVAASDWKSCTPSNPITDDLSIPASFLRRSK